MAAQDDAKYEADTGEDLPWLEPAELEYNEAPRLMSQRAIIIGAVTIIVIIGLLWLVAETLGNDDIEIPQGEVPLVQAPKGPFKTAPRERGGLVVSENERMTNDVASGEALPSDVAVDQVPEVAVPVVPPVGTGEARNAPQDLLNGGPEGGRSNENPPEPARPPRRETQETAPVSAAPANDAPAPAAAAPMAGGATIQLGAFSSRSKAAEVWETLSNRYGYLAPLQMTTETVTVNGNTLYRLRAAVGAPAAAKDICNRLKLAGEQCVVI